MPAARSKKTIKKSSKKKYLLTLSVLGFFLFILPFIFFIRQQSQDLKPSVKAASNASVNIIDFQFSPATITVPVGTTVTWTNMSASGSMHTTSSDTQGTADSWDSGLTTKGTTFSHTFNTAGTFTYHCNVHTFMRGTIVVSAAAAAPTAIPAAPTSTPTTAVPPTTSVPSPVCLGTSCVSPTVPAPTIQPVTSTSPIPTLAVNPPSSGGNQNFFSFLLYFISLILQFLQSLAGGGH